MPWALLHGASFSSRQPSAGQPPAFSSTRSTAPCSCNSFPFYLFAWHLLILLTLEPVLIFFFSLFSPLQNLSLPCPGGCPYETPPFFASWASFVRSQTKALHRCPCYVGAYTVGSCHAKYECVIKFPWGNFPFQSLYLRFSKAVVSNVCPPVFSHSYFIILILRWTKILSLVLGER